MNIGLNQRSYCTPCSVSAGVGDSLWMGTSPSYIQATQVNSAQHPLWVGMSTDNGFSYHYRGKHRQFAGNDVA